jgi:hypothetical protein
MSEGRLLLWRDEAGLLRFQLDDLIRDNPGMSGEVLGIVERLMAALRRTCANRSRARAMLAPGMSLLLGGRPNSHDTSRHLAAARATLDISPVGCPGRAHRDPANAHGWPRDS